MSDSTINRSRGVRPAVYWVLGSDGCFASSRLQGLLIHRQLQHAGLVSHVLYSPPRWRANRLIAARPIIDHVRFTPGDICVIQKVDGPEIEQLIMALKRRNVKTIYVECDYRPEVLTWTECDAVVCPSEVLCGKLRKIGGHTNVHYISDPVEWIRNPRPQSTGTSYKLVWVGNRTNWESLSMIREVLADEEFADLSLETISDHPDATRPWTLRKALDHWSDADVCVVPTTSDAAAQSKSNNRVTQAMALGLAVVCGDIPAYQEVIEHGKTGLICHSADDYRLALRSLRDPKLREQVRHAGNQWVRDRYRVAHAAVRWQELFAELSPRFGHDGTPASWWQRVRTSIAARRCRAELLALLVREGTPSVSDGWRCLQGSIRQWPFQARLPWHAAQKGLTRATRLGGRP